MRRRLQRWGGRLGPRVKALLAAGVLLAFLLVGVGVWLWRNAQPLPPPSERRAETILARQRLVAAEARLELDLFIAEVGLGLEAEVRERRFRRIVRALEEAYAPLDDERYARASALIDEAQALLALQPAEAVALLEEARAVLAGFGGLMAPRHNALYGAEDDEDQVEEGAGE
jgi:hypothetical protein